MDPVELGKITDHHKLLCQSSQEPLPVRGITSAYEQKCSRASSKPKISGFLQPTFLGSKAKQSLETYCIPEQTKSFLQGGKIQNGDTGNHQDLPSTRGVGYLNRFFHIPIQEQSRIYLRFHIQGRTYQFKALPFVFVYSTHGVHCSSKRVETDGHTQGYKDPPVPRRLVGESQIPLGLSPAYTRANKNVSGTGLAGEFVKIRAGSQTSLRICWLPV